MVFNSLGLTLLLNNQTLNTLCGVICHVKMIRVDETAALVKKFVISTLFYQGGNYTRVL